MTEVEMVVVEVEMEEVEVETKEVEHTPPSPSSLSPPTPWSILEDVTEVQVERGKARTSRF